MLGEFGVHVVLHAGHCENCFGENSETFSEQMKAMLRAENAI
jgi:hypothetical protein